MRLAWLKGSLEIARRVEVWVLDEFSRHGGALDMARRRFPDAPEPWLDLSTGINPVPYPIDGLSLDTWARLPEAAAIRELERAAATRYRVPEDADTLAAAGTQAIIQRLPAVAGGADVRILGRSYGEFATLFRGSGARVREVPTPGALAGADVAVVVNPNNPDGRLVPIDELLDLSPRVGTLIVDEAFADPLPRAMSVVPNLPLGRTIVLRSFGKFFGLAGLRLGFAVGPRDRIATLRKLIGPWPVSGPAIAVGRRALGDDTWIAETRARVEKDGGRLAHLLERAGVRVVGTSRLFVLGDYPEAARLFASLAKRGILTRPFADEPTWLRFGLPGTDEGWQRLEIALADRFPE